MKVIVTGAGGLLGRDLVAAARQAGYETIALGRTAAAPAGLACDHWIGTDLAAPAAQAHPWEEHAGAAVFHLAADTRIYEPGRDFQRESAAVTAGACAIARRTGGRLVFFSSSAVYSGARTQRPVARLRETDEAEPATDYGRAKRAAEESIGNAGLDAVVLRVFGVLAPGLAGAPARGNLVQAILRAAQEGGEVTLATDAAGAPAVRDYVLAGDLCRQALAALAWPRPARGALTVNVCTGEGTSVAEMVAQAAAVAGRPIPVRLAGSSQPVNPVMVGDPARLRKLAGSIPANRVREFWEELLAGPARFPGAWRGVAGGSVPR